MPTRVIDHADAMAVARGWFLDGRPIDMRQLADELAVGRATLYRVVGSRDRLLGDILYGLSVATLRQAKESAAARTEPGAERLVQTALHLNEAIVSFEPIRTFMSQDPETAFRVLFMPAARVHERAVETWHNVIADAVAADHMPSPGDLDRVAFMFVRIGESMIFADLLAGRDPDLSLAAELQRCLLSPDAHQH